MVLVFGCSVAAMNNDSWVWIEAACVKFPLHRDRDARLGIVVGKGYFGFQGWQRLINKPKGLYQEEFIDTNPTSKAADGHA